MNWDDVKDGDTIYLKPDGTAVMARCHKCGAYPCQCHDPHVRQHVIDDFHAAVERAERAALKGLLREATDRPVVRRLQEDVSPGKPPLEHRWSALSNRCEACHVVKEAVEDGFATKVCPGRPGVFDAGLSELYRRIASLEDALERAGAELLRLSEKGARLNADNDALRRQLMARERDTGGGYKPRPLYRWGPPV